MGKAFLVSILSVALISTGCASRSLALAQTAPATSNTQRDTPQSPLLVDYLQRLAPGSKVRIERSNGSVLRGTLMGATAERIVVHENTRVPEPPVTLAIAEVARVTVEGQSSVGKTIGIGVAAGAGATLGVILLLAMLWSD